MIRALRLGGSDDVAILVDPAAPGDDVLGVAARDAVPAGHKMALRAIAAGSPVRKYGQVIGVAAKDIAAGEHVHSHNLVVGGAPVAAATPAPEAGAVAMSS